MTPEKALNLLYGIEERDLSGDGYRTALQKLRGESPKLANQVERVLKDEVDGAVGLWSGLISYPIQSGTS